MYFFRISSFETFSVFCSTPWRSQRESQTAARQLLPLPTYLPLSPPPGKGCAAESEKSPKKSPKPRFCLFSDSVAHSLGLWGSPGPEAPAHPFGLSFRTLLGFRARRARETSVPGRGVPNPNIQNYCRRSSFQRPINSNCRYISRVHA